MNCRVGLVGYGEVGRILAEDLRARGVAHGVAYLAAYDIKLGTAAEVPLRAYGVEDSVLASLGETFPGVDWETQGAYFFQRVIQHGRRRAEEMREAAATVREVGLEPWSAAGTAERQAFVADLAEGGKMGDRLAPRSDWRADADRLLAAIARND